MCATAVLADPDPATRAVLLGHDSVAAYGEWIRNEMHWGGEPEIVMLAEHFGVEAVVTSCESMRSLRYGDGGRAVHLLYTGQHYDPLVSYSHKEFVANRGQVVEGGGRLWKVVEGSGR